MLNALILAIAVDFPRLRVALDSPSPSAQTDARAQYQSNDGLRILRLAFQKLQQYPTSPFAVYTVTWHVVERPAFGGGEQDRSYRSRYAWRSVDGKENWSNDIPHKGLPFARVLQQFLGPFAWTLRSSYAVPRTAPMEMHPDVEALQTIASVSVSAKPSYKITIVGEESVDGHSTFHLHLEPITDPVRHNLRDLWVDKQTFDLWRARFATAYNGNPTTVTTILATIGEYHIVTQASWAYSGLGAYFVCETELNHIVFPYTLPDWLFDISQYNQHKRAGDADPIASLLPQTGAASPER